MVELHVHVLVNSDLNLKIITIIKPLSIPELLAIPPTQTTHPGHHLQSPYLDIKPRAAKFLKKEPTVYTNFVFLMSTISLLEN